MDSVNRSPAARFFNSFWLKWSLLGVAVLITGYLSVLMYANGEYTFAILALVIIGTGIYIFANSKTYAWRYVYPGLAGIGLFILFPLIYTIGIGFTNYSNTNQLTFERAQEVLLDRTYITGQSYSFELYAQQHQWIIALSGAESQKVWVSQPFDLEHPSHVIALHVANALPKQPAVSFRMIIQNRNRIGALKVRLPHGEQLMMSSLRRFSAVQPLYKQVGKAQMLVNQKTSASYLPNYKTGFYQQILADGHWGKEVLSPGFSVNIGWANFTRIVTDRGIRMPFIDIFIWTIIFATLTVVFTVIIGMVLACLVQWEALKGKASYRVLLILPYAVPAFISILIFKGLFNQSFGEINLLLSQVFGLRPEWFSNPHLAKAMVLIVNTWLGYPYMMILCMGLLKAIPDDLYEAAAMDGAGPMQNFFKITVPLLLKPLTPLLIASFAFNFNNFVLIQLLTNGGPDRLGTTTPAGYTDLLVSYTYRIAFEGSGGQNFGLAAAISTLIFVLVGALAIINLKASKLQLD
ncbi:maltose ABC transporter permease MalF [Celerinatantimonas yamalensis]|uniref:Maltose/maltodextrin transport system permease protein n=1 Tax=Celerinatantimonas yamalensis TaxID=559956 RepID=A0ABW9GAG2_9GAMM